MKKIILLLTAFNFILFAQSEILINTNQLYSQRDPQIARDGNGNFVVVFDGDSPATKSDIYF